MALEIDGIATSLFEKIRARFEDVSVGDQDAKATQEPGKARFFNFDYTDASGENFGNVTVSLIDEKSLKIYFGKNLSADLDEMQKSEWYDFLRDMRMFAKRNLLSFDTRDISRSNLNLKDLKQLSTSEKPADVNDLSMTNESKYYGTTKKSYYPITSETRLIILHSGAVDETIHGARSRKIQSIYVEDGQGQRFKVTNHLPAAKALGRHIASGGEHNDDFSKHIVELAEELRDLRKFVGLTRHKTFEDNEATAMVQSAKERHNTIHHILRRMNTNRGYNLYKEQWDPNAGSSALNDDVDLDDVRSKFVQASFDKRLEPGLNHVAKAYKSSRDATPDVSQFSEWVESVTEDSDDGIKMKKLQELMSTKLPAGMDGNNAIPALQDISVGDDSLYDTIYKAADGSDEVDVRPIVYKWLKNHEPSVAHQIMQNHKMSGGAPAKEPPKPEPAPSPAPPPAAAPPATPNTQQPPAGQTPPAKSDPNDIPTESVDHLSSIRRLAGLK
jgi:hypothetical protein